MPVLEQRKMHCQKSLLTRGTHCIVLFRHYDLLESIWPFQCCSARLLLMAASVKLFRKQTTPMSLFSPPGPAETLHKYPHFVPCLHETSILKYLGHTCYGLLACTTHAEVCYGCFRTQCLSSNMDGYYSYHTCKLVGS